VGGEGDDGGGIVVAGGTAEVDVGTAEPVLVVDGSTLVGRVLAVLVVEGGGGAAVELIALVVITRVVVGVGDGGTPVGPVGSGGPGSGTGTATVISSVADTERVTDRDMLRTRCGGGGEAGLDGLAHDTVTAS
jgi:hypothetical protein